MALCAVLLVLCIVLAIGWSKAAKTDTALPEVRNNGTAIQWKYSDETDWRDLVALTELRGAAVENGNDGLDGKDGINGVNGKSIEVQRTTEYIQWRYEGEEWQNLVAIADIEGPAGQNGKDGANGKTLEFRVNENTLQWHYVGDEIWLNLYDLTALKGADGRDGIDGKDGINGQDGRDGADGTNGQNGSDGKDGNTPFIGENGNWWIGEIDTAVKAAGTDGTDGVDGDKGDKGDPGEKGDKGDKGDPGEKGDKGDSGVIGYYGFDDFKRKNLGNSNSYLEPDATIIQCGNYISYDNDNGVYTFEPNHTYYITVTLRASFNSNSYRILTLRGKHQNNFHPDLLIDVEEAIKGGTTTYTTTLMFTSSSTNNTLKLYLDSDLAILNYLFYRINILVLS